MKPQVLSKEVVGLLQDRINYEYKIFYFYHSASNWCNDKGFMKAAKFFADESLDETTHAKILIDYCVGWNVLPELPNIESPDTDFDSLLDIIEQAYTFELQLYADYEDTSGKVLKMGEFCTFDVLQKLRAIQNESVIMFSDKLNICEGVDANSKFEMLMIEDKLF
jgi:ferritin